MTRQLEHPVIEVEDEEEGESLRLRFYAPGSKLGAIEVVLSFEEVETLQGSLDQAVTFSGATAGDSDG